MSIRTRWVILAGLCSCASTASTSPLASSAAEHEAAAQRAEEESARYRGDYDPGAWQQRPCPPRYGLLTPLCWSDARNPTERYLEEAARKHEEAERHLAASRALRDTERTACGSVATPDRETSPFDHVADLVSVEPLMEGGQLRGAVATFRRVPGATAEALGKVAACHVARNAVVGHQHPPMIRCPLSVAGVEVVAKEVADGLALVMRVGDRSAAAEVLARARAAAANPKLP